ncbi:MAG: GNAT family N-acetyltransferase [Solirubrobacteraceae bacterium]|nr:GNAT family N-acetyltransferase [Solirubrobacteraceae bacterium]
MSSPQQLEIRHAVPGDAAAIATVHVEGYDSAHRGILDPASLAVRNFELRRRVWSERLADPPARSFVLVAVEGGEVVGFVSGRTAHPDEDGGLGEGRVENIYVLSRCRPRSRVAAPLMEASLDAMAELGYTIGFGFVAEGNDRSRNFLRGLGWHHDGYVIEVEGLRQYRIRHDLPSSARSPSGEGPREPSA